MCMIYDASVSFETIELRPAEPDDFAQVQALHQAAYLCNVDETQGLTSEVMRRHVYDTASGERPVFGERIMNGYHQWMANEQAQFTVADVDGTVTGYSTAVNGDQQSLLDGLYVDPAYHGRGIGSLLLRHAEKLAAQPVVLWAVTHAPVRTFYKKHGYEETNTDPQTIPIVGGLTMQLVEMRQRQDRL